MGIRLDRCRARTGLGRERWCSLAAPPPGRLFKGVVEADCTRTQRLIISSLDPAPLPDTIRKPAPERRPLTPPMHIASSPSTHGSVEIRGGEQFRAAWASQAARDARCGGLDPSYLHRLEVSLLRVQAGQAVGSFAAFLASISATQPPPC